MKLTWLGDHDMIAIFCFWCLNTVIYIACLNLILITNFWQSHLVEFLVLFFGRSTSQEHVKKIWHVQCHHERLVKPLYMINTCTNTSSTHAHMICDPDIWFVACIAYNIHAMHVIFLIFLMVNITIIIIVFILHVYILLSTYKLVVASFF